MGLFPLIHLAHYNICFHLTSIEQFVKEGKFLFSCPPTQRPIIYIMFHSENSTMIQNYIAQYQEGAITLEGLWYNIQPPLHNLFQKEELLQVHARDP